MLCRSLYTSLSLGLVLAISTVGCKTGDSASAAKSDALDAGGGIQVSPAPAAMASTDLPVGAQFTILPEAISGSQRHGDALIIPGGTYWTLIQAYNHATYSYANIDCHIIYSMKPYDQYLYPNQGMPVTKVTADPAGTVYDIAPNPQAGQNAAQVTKVVCAYHEDRYYYPFNVSQMSCALNAWVNIPQGAPLNKPTACAMPQPITKSITFFNTPYVMAQAATAPTTPVYQTKWSCDSCSWVAQGASYSFGIYKDGIGYTNGGAFQELAECNKAHDSEPKCQGREN